MQLDTCVLDVRDQRRNILLYSLCTSMVYFSAAVVYVGIVAAGLCQNLGASDTVANLPIAAFYLAMSTPLVVAWRFHSAAAIKPVLFFSFLVAAMGCVLVAATLFFPASNRARIVAVILHSAATGCALSVTSIFQWDVISRGIDARRRGTALSLAHGIGPLFAVVGSLGAQVLLAGEVLVPWYDLNLGWHWMQIARAPAAFPSNYAELFIAAAVLLAIAALFSTRYVVPRSLTAELPRAPMMATLMQQGRVFLSNATLRRTIAAYLLVGSAGTAVSTMTLFATETTGNTAPNMAGYQSAIGFVFKVAAGLILGWLVATTNARVGTMATALLFFAGIVWALTASQGSYVLCFGFMGAGDLYGVYFPYYVMAASAQQEVRQNIAYLHLLGLPVCVAPALLGAISDEFGRQSGLLFAAASVTAALILMATGLPRNPGAPKSKLMEFSSSLTSGLN